MATRHQRHRRTYREPTTTGLLETVGSDLWGAGVAGERSDLHKVLFISSGGTLEQWETPTEDPHVAARIHGTGVQADAVIEWLAGRDRRGL